MRWLARLNQAAESFQGQIGPLELWDGQIIENSSLTALTSRFWQGGSLGQALAGAGGSEVGTGGRVVLAWLAQYQAMRKSLPADVLLMLRLGDFYEMFFEDAKTASPILNVALTRRNGVPMCGVIARKLLFG